MTSETFAADFGGVDGGDALCQAAAEAAGLDGTFKAWLSDSSADVVDRFADGTCWKRVDDVLVAADLADLTDGELSALISVDEYGEARSGYVWTGSTSAGVDTYDCDDWSATDGNAKVGAAADDNDGANPVWWTTRGNTGCGGTYRLYCFEQ